MEERKLMDAEHEHYQEDCTTRGIIPLFPCSVDKYQISTCARHGLGSGNAA